MISLFPTNTTPIVSYSASTIIPQQPESRYVIEVEDDESPALVGTISGTAPGGSTASGQQRPLPRVLGELPASRSALGVREYFRVLTRWTGYVQSVGDTTFTAVIHDETAANPDDVAEILLTEVPDADRDLLSPGAVFYWSIGYRRSAFGQHTRVSELRLQRLPPWQDEELVEARSRASALRESLVDEQRET